MKKEEKTRYLLKNTVIFAFSNLATKLITLFLIPLYTFCLSTSEYGIVDLLFTLASVIVPILTLNIVEAIYRFSMDKDADNNKIMSIGILLFIVCIISGLLFIPLFNIFPTYAKYKYYFYFYLISTAGFQIFSINLKGQEKLKQFSAVNILNTFLIAILNIYFLKILNYKIEGYFIAYIIANTLAMIYAIYVGKIFKNIKKFKIDKSLFKEMTKYSIVLIPTSFMWWIMKSSDRVMLTYYSGLALNGIYAISYKIPTILQAIATIFNQAWIFTAVKEKNSEDNEQYTNLVFENLFVVITICAAFLILIVKLFLKFFVSNEYFTAWKYVPFLLIGSLFVTLGTFLSSSYSANKDSKGFLFSGLFGALINIILNFVLIPSFKAYGAAIATCLSYITVFIYRYIDTQKYVKIKINKKNIVGILLLVTLSILLYSTWKYIFIIQLCVFIILLFYYKNNLFGLFKKIFILIKKRKDCSNE